MVVREKDSVNNAVMKFTDIFGQDRAIDAIAAAYRADRLPHAMIFAGPVGVGKRTTALALAGLFLCEKPADLSPCGKCQSCIAFDAGSHPDYHRVYKNLIRSIKGDDELKPVDLSIDVLREELIKKAAMKSIVGVGKVFVVEQADLMNVYGQNSILKTLEEPYGRALVILLTDNPDGLLPTVRSRCRTFRFSPLDVEAVQRELIKRGQDKTVASQAARLSEGSLGLAIKWIEDGVIAPAGELLERMNRIVAGKPPSDMPDWFKKAAETYAEKQLAREKNDSKAQATRDGLLLYLHIAASHLRKRLTELTDADALERTCGGIDALVRAEKYINANVTISLVFQELSVSLDEQFAVAR